MEKMYNLYDVSCEHGMGKKILKLCGSHGKTELGSGSISLFLCSDFMLLIFHVSCSCIMERYHKYLFEIFVRSLRKVVGI